MESSGLSAEDRSAAEALAADLRRVFGERLRSLVAYGLQHRAAGEPDGTPLHTLALVDRITFDDLAACLPLVSAWNRRGLAVPLILGRHEFERSLDVFPLEYGDIIAHHVVVSGRTPFEGATVATSDMRRACEQQAKSHLIHLREAFLESGGRPEQVAQLIAASARPFRVLLENIARLDGHEAEDIAAAAERQIGLPAGVVRDVLSVREGHGTIADPTALLAQYIATVEQLWMHVDTWRGR